MNDIKENENWLQLYEMKRLIEKSCIDSQKHGYCKVYIPRKRRYCLCREADGLNGFCTEHYTQQHPIQGIPTTTNANKIHKCDTIPSSSSSTAIDAAPNNQSSSWHLKTNINRRMKKMTNPLAKQY